MREKTAVFIGNNECFGLPKGKLEKTIIECIERGITVFLSGGQGGFDRMAAGAVHKIKSGYPNIKNVLVIPYLSFNVFNKEIFDEIIYPADFEKYHYKAAIPQRNKYMVENAEVAICYVKDFMGGAGVTYAYAKQIGLKIMEL